MAATWRRRRSSGCLNGPTASFAAAVLSLAVVLCGAGNPRPARAAGFDADFFKPTTVSTGTFCEENGLTVVAGQLDVSVAGGYAHRPIVRAKQLGGAPQGDVVRDRVTTYLAAGYGITNRIDVGFRLAAVVRQVGNVEVDIADDGGVPQRPRSTALGDFDLIARAALVQVDRPHRRFRLTLLAPLGIPTGAPDALAGNGKLSFRPRLIAGWYTVRRSLAVSVGYAYTPATEVQSSSLVVGQALVAGVGFAYAVIPAALWIQAETSVTLGVALSETGRSTFATQLMAGPRALLPGDIFLQAGLGTGLTHAVGAPRWSAVVTLARMWGG